MKKFMLILVIITVSCTTASSQMRRGMMGKSSESYSPQLSPEQHEKLDKLIRISRGGQLYDNWWKTTTETDKPNQDHPLWQEQSTNKRSGYDTFRCKECHGWDYNGKDGAYGKGSHYTGFKGILEASEKLSLEKLEAVLKGSTNSKHDFSAYLKSNDIADLALFMKQGLIDTSKFIDNKGLPIGGNQRTGSYIFQRNCTHMCHGGAGIAINFGDDKEPEFVGTIAHENPWEFLHKVRNGQPGARMPSAIINEWSEKDLIDLLSFAQTLPRDESEIGWWRGLWRDRGHRDMMHGDFGPGRGRGFGPIIE